MSDLHRAVEAELDAHRPPVVPPFEQVRARKRRREQRRAGAGVVLSVVAVAGIAFLPSALGSDNAPRTTVYAAPGPTEKVAAPPGVRPGGGDPAGACPYVPGGTVGGCNDTPPASERFTVGYDTRAAYESEPDETRLQQCLALPGTSERATARSLPPQHLVTVTGQAEIQAFRDCVNALPGVNVNKVGTSRPGATSPAPDADLVLTTEQEAFIEQCLGGNIPLALPAPGFVGQSEAEANPPNADTPYLPRIVGRDGECLDRTDDRQDKRVNLIIEDGVVIWAGRF